MGVEGRIYRDSAQWHHFLKQEVKHFVYNNGVAPYAPANVNLLIDISNQTGNSGNLFPIDNLNDNEPDSLPEDMDKGKYTF